MIRQRILQFSAFLACVIVGGGAHGDIVGFADVLSSLEPVIVAGDPGGVPADSPANRVDANTTTSRFAGVGSFTDTAGALLGTGTPISPIHILTAAHLVSDGTNTAAPANITFNLNYGSNLSHSISASAIAVHSDFDGFDNPPGTVNDDLAVITLAMPLPAGVPIYPLLTTPVVAGTTLTFAGYGASGDGVNGHTVGGDPATKRTGKNNADAFGLDDEAPNSDVEVFLFDFDGPTTGMNFLGGTTLGNDQETSFGGGDSGGPAFVDDGTTLWLAGVNTFLATFTGGPTFPLFDSGGGGILIYSYQDFIASAVPEANALLSVGVVVTSSLAAAWVRRRMNRRRVAIR